MGRKKGTIAWNKGLDASDPRVKKYMETKRNKYTTNKTCLACGVEFNVPNCFKNAKFCCIKCRDSAPKPKGSFSPRWKGGIWRQGSGYLYINLGENKSKPLHRYLYEKYHKTQLSENDIVHHINGNKLDNRIENLMVMTRAEHIIYHKTKPVTGSLGTLVTNVTN